MLLSRTTLQRVLGILWLVDGLLQLQPQMFTMNMVNGVMRPTLVGQPGFLEAGLQFIITQTTLHLVAINLLVAIAQILLGLGFLLLPLRWIKGLVIASFVWALIVWFGGEGLSMLLTGTSSALSGSPGAVILYPLLGLAVWPRKQPAETARESVAVTRDNGLLSRKVLHRVLAGFWFFAALLQVQPYWWQPGQISGAISAMVGQGGLNSVLVDPILTQLSHITSSIETPLNIALIVVFLAIGIGLAIPGDRHMRIFLIASAAVSVLIWYSSQAFGMVLTGMATDFNSGLLLVVIALACWPRTGIKQTVLTRLRASTAGLFPGLDRYLAPRLGRWSFVASGSVMRGERQAQVVSVKISPTLSMVEKVPQTANATTSVVEKTPRATASALLAVEKTPGKASSTPPTRGKASRKGKHKARQQSRKLRPLPVHSS